MSYEPTIWQDFDVITADKLNKLENGVASAGGGAESPIFWITLTYNSYQDAGTRRVMDCDTAFADIATASYEGKVIGAIIVDNYDDGEGMTGTIRKGVEFLSSSDFRATRYKIDNSSSHLIIYKTSIYWDTNQTAFVINDSVKIADIPIS